MLKAIIQMQDMMMDKTKNNNNNSKERARFLLSVCRFLREDPPK